MKFFHLFKKLKGHDWDIFNENDSKLFYEIENMFNVEAWEEVMNHINNTNMHYKQKNLITKNACLLSKKIQNEVGIIVFPIVERIYLGSMHNDEGYATWKMYQSNMNTIGSNQPVREFLLKKNGIESMHDSICSQFLLIKKKS